jgi:hypothetical protein
METWDFIFYGETIKAQKPVKGQLRLFPATKKSTSDLSKPPKPITSRKGEDMGLVAALYRASNQASTSKCPSKMIAVKGGE